VNKLFGLIVLGLAVAVGFGSISGCPAKVGTTVITIMGTAGDVKADTTMKLTIIKAGEAPPPSAKLTLTLPPEVDGDIKMGSAKFDVMVKRENYDKDVKLTFKTDAKGVTFKGDTIPAGMDKVTVDVTIDKTATAGTSDLTVHAMGGDAKADGKTKLVLK